MMNVKSILATTVLGVGALVGSASAQQPAALQNVQYGYGYYNNYNPYYDHEQREYDDGYRRGAQVAGDDVRLGRGFILYDHGDYKEHRDREYREGFERGYREAFHQYRHRYGHRWHDRDWDDYWAR